MSAGKTKNMIHVIVRSRLFLILSLAVAWLCFYSVLASSDRRGFPKAGDTESDFALPTIASSLLSDVAPEEETDALERPYPVFNFPDLRLSRLAEILRDEGVGLTYPPALESVTFDALEYGGRPLAEIMIGILEPHRHGFYRQNGQIHVVEMQIERQRAPEGPDDRRFQSSKVRATLRAAAGDPIDLWVETDPLVRLRIVAQPLYGESDENEIGLAVEARREGKLWFYDNTRVHVGSETQFHSSSGESVWLRIKPLGLTDSQIDFEVQFQHDTTVPSS